MEVIRALERLYAMTFLQKANVIDGEYAALAREMNITRKTKPGTGDSSISCSHASR